MMLTRWYLCLLACSMPAAELTGVAVIEKQCLVCHGASKMSGLDLRQRETALQGGKKGPAFKPGKAEESLIIKMVTGAAQPKMPPGKDSLSAAELAALKKWIDSGGSWTSDINSKLAAGWSFTKPVKPEIPKVRNVAWVSNPIDAFLLEKLEAKGLKPPPPASKLTLLRRVTFDLSGVPPTENEIRDFLADTSANAYEKVIDRLLTSPRYGERWGRHWLDVARYADSTGLDEDHRYPHAWRYRDWVIKAIGADMPYDQFVKMQIAGDLLPPAPGQDANFDGIVATGFLALGPKPIAQQDKKQMVYDVIDEQIDVTSKAFLGVTLSCARCHDHKFDPFPTTDYYSMASIFASTKTFAKVGNGGVSQMYSHPLVPRNEYDAYQAQQNKIGALRKQMESIRDAESSVYSGNLRARLSAYMFAAWKVNHKQADAKALAASDKLDADLLGKWAKYLKTGDDHPQHLEEWTAANEQTVTSVVAGYQDRYDKSSAAYDKMLARWRNRVESSAKANMEPPERPKPDAVKDKFFEEVAFGQGPFALPRRNAESLFSAEARAKYAEVREQIAALDKNKLPEPPQANSVSEGDAFDQKVHVRGSYGNLGDPVRKRFPLILTGGAEPQVKSVSGRLEMAEWMASPSNPLTARVMANRIWQWHFTDGIVRTPNNFGKLGQRPTHPELLDWLAVTFVENGWSLKKMHKLILLSNAYRMSSDTSDAAAKADPANQLFSSFPRRRLDVEEIRDSYLTMDDSIDWKAGGTLQSGSGTDGENSSKRLSLSPEAYSIRTVYLPLRRSNLPNLFNLFDFVDSTTSCEARSRTNVAPQALFVMNSQFVAARAQGLAKKLIAEEKDDRARAGRAYLRVLNRGARPAEMNDALEYIAAFASKTKGADAALKSWESYLRVLMASNEFVYVD